MQTYHRPQPQSQVGTRREPGPPWGHFACLDNFWQAALAFRPPAFMENSNIFSCAAAGGWCGRRHPKPRETGLLQAAGLAPGVGDQHTVPAPPEHARTLYFREKSLSKGETSMLFVLEATHWTPMPNGPHRLSSYMKRTRKQQLIRPAASRWAALRTGTWRRGNKGGARSGAFTQDSDSLRKPHMVTFHHFNFYHPSFKLFSLSSLLDVPKNKCHALELNIKYEISPLNVSCCLSAWPQGLALSDVLPAQSRSDLTKGA